MVKIINKGFTLIELLMYMSILSIMLLSIISSFIYFQKIIQNNNYNYFIRNQIYGQLNVVQQYLLNNRAVLHNDVLTIFDRYDNQIYDLDVSSNKIRNIYQLKGYDFYLLENTNFKNIKTEYLSNYRIIKYEFSWLDMFNREQYLTEYLIVINQKM